MIEWKDTLATGVNKIDSQHQELFQRINNLISAMGTSSANKDVRELFTYLENYIRTHFTMEETLMVETQYPDFLDHQAQHIGYIKAFAQLKQSYLYEESTTKVVIKLRSVLVQWWLNHIGRRDKALGEYIRNRNTHQ